MERHKDTRASETPLTVLYVAYMVAILGCLKEEQIFLQQEEPALMSATYTVTHIQVPMML